MSQLPMQRSVSVPGAADAGIEQSPTEQHSFFSPTVAAHASPENGEDVAAAGHSHHPSHSSIDSAIEPQTPNEANTSAVANSLLQGTVSFGQQQHGGERRNSRPNVRLAAAAPAKLSSAALAVPSSTLFAPASPMTPAIFGVPPNTPMQLSSLSLAGEPVTPLYDQPFTPMQVPMSPMLPQAPPSTPLPRLSISAASGNPSVSPSASPHPIRHIMNLPTTMTGIDVLAPKPTMHDIGEVGEHEEAADATPKAADAQQQQKQSQQQSQAAQAGDLLTEEQFFALQRNHAETTFDYGWIPEEAPPSPPGEKESPSVYAANSIAVNVLPSSPVASGAPSLTGAAGSSSSSANVSEQLLLHRSRLGRLSIIQREDLRQNGVGLSASSSSPPPAGVVAGPGGAHLTHQRSSSMMATAIADMSPEELVKHSKLHGPTVIEVTRVAHINFDPNATDDAAMKNVPPEWREALQKQFGLPASLCTSVKLPQYPARIPLVLVRMHEYLKQSKALETQVGIFRLAPDANECTALKNAINASLSNLESTTNTSDKPNCVANLIKVWFRDLPVALFQPIPPAALATLGPETTRAQIDAIITQHLKEPMQSIFRWLVDLCCDVTQHSATTKMVAKNVSICVSPNLYKPPVLKSQQNTAEALKIMQQCKLYTDFLEIAIGLREVERGQPKTSTV